ncbi:MAG TPA: hypothetical protein VJT09_02535 [Pyrinomonadaceae bacterium]|nr:hypothetical protein [Pyrinomonadaceae bacterium]
MRKLMFAALALLLALPLVFASSNTRTGASVAPPQEDGRRVLTGPHRGRRRRVRGDYGRGRHGIRRSFKRAGLSAGRGGRRFGRNMARGRVVRAGGALGKGMGGFGKHTGRGVGRTMRRVFKP